MRNKWPAAGVLCSAVVLLVAPHAVAQGCTMCYQTASASGASSREALRHGILILLLPAAGLFLGVFGLIYHRRNQAR